MFCDWMMILFMYIVQSEGGGGDCARARDQTMILSSRLCSARRVNEWLLRSTFLRFLSFSTLDLGEMAQ